MYIGKHPDQKWSISWCISLVLVAIIGIYAFFVTTSGIIASPFDTDKQVCGHDQNVVDYPFIYFVSPDQNNLWRTVCLKYCPQKGDTFLSCKTNSNVQHCKENISQDPSQQILIYDSIEYVGSICLPSKSSYFEVVSKAILQSWSIKNMRSVMVSQLAFFMIYLCSTVLASFIIIFLYNHSYFLIWSVLLWNILFLAATIAMCAYRARLSILLTTLFQKNNYGTLAPHEAIRYANLDGENTTFLIFLASFFLILMITLIVCLRLFSKKVHYLSLLVQVGVEFLGYNPYLIYLSTLMAICSFFNFQVWIFIVINLWNHGSISQVQEQTPYVVFQTSVISKILSYMVTIILLWNQLIMSCVVDFFTEALTYQWYLKERRLDEDQQIMIQNNYHVVEFLKKCLKDYPGVIIKGAFMLIAIQPIKPLLYLTYQYREYLLKHFPILKPLLEKINTFYYEQILSVQTQTFLECYRQNQIEFMNAGLELNKQIDSHETNRELFETTNGFGNLFTKAFSAFGGFFAMGAYYAICLTCSSIDQYMVFDTLGLSISFFIGASIGSIYYSLIGESINGLTTMMVVDNNDSFEKKRYGLSAPLMLLNFYRMQWYAQEYQ